MQRCRENIIALLGHGAHIQRKKVSSGEVSMGWGEEARCSTESTGILTKDLKVMSHCCFCQSLSHVWPFATQWTIACQVSLSFTITQFAKTHVHWVSDAIQPSHPLLPPSLLSLNLCQHQVLFQWVGSLHQVAKVLEIQVQHQSFQWIFRVDCL